MKIQPIENCVLPGTQPMPLYQTQIDRVAHAFEEQGWSSHSSRGAMMWAVIAYARANAIPYSVWRHTSGEGYGVLCKSGSQAPPATGAVLESLGFREVKDF